MIRWFLRLFPAHRAALDCIDECLSLIEQGDFRNGVTMGLGHPDEGEYLADERMETINELLQVVDPFILPGRFGR